jgi:hypothetical protein
MRESHRWICNSWERGTESEANAPEDGRILNRVYENKYFGFSIRLPVVFLAHSDAFNATEVFKAQALKLDAKVLADEFAAG